MHLWWIDPSYPADTDGYRKRYGVHTKPYDDPDWLDEQLAEGHVLVPADKEVPEPPEVKRGEDVALWFHPQTLDVVWKVIKRPLMPEEQIAEAIERLENEIRASMGHMYAEWTIGVAYEIGEVCRYDQRLYEIVQAHISQDDWRPSNVPALYKSYTEVGEIADWVQPTGAHDAYPLGALVKHNGEIWESIVDANVWEPGVYGWEMQ